MAAVEGGSRDKAKLMRLKSEVIHYNETGRAGGGEANKSSDRIIKEEKNTWFGGGWHGGEAKHNTTAQRGAPK